MNNLEKTFPSTPEAQAEQSPEKSLTEKTGEEITLDSYTHLEEASKEISETLGVAPESPEATRLTETYLAESIKDSIDADGEIASGRTHEVHNLIASATMESVDATKHEGRDPDDTPLGRALNDEPETAFAITGVIDTLESKDVKTLDGESAAMAARRLIDGMDGQSGDRTIESSEEQSFESEIQHAIETARERTEKGLERTDFASAEVYASIGDYYQDHTLTLSILEGVAQNTDPSLLKSAVKNIENETMKQALESALRMEGPAQKKRLANIADAAFAETCVGQLTLDADLKADLAKQKGTLSYAFLKDAADLAGTHENLSEYERNLYRLTATEEQSIAAAERQIDTAIEKTRNEVRPAGQLLFHNTGHTLDVWRSTSLKGRQKQLTDHGDTLRQTADIQNHSLNVHWSERYDPISYKSSLPGSTEHGGMAATIALPIGEIVKQAPYGRGLEYSTASVRNDRSIDTLTVDKTNAVGEIGAGAAEVQGDDYLSIDRVFWASNSDREAGLDVDFSVIGPGAIHNGENATYIIQGENDTIRSASANSARVYEQASTNEEKSRIAEKVQTINSAIAEYGSIDHPNNGAGEGYPHVVKINDLHLSDEELSQPFINSPLVNDPFELASRIDKDVTIDAIMKIQQESMQRYEGEYVVPLRAAEADFMQQYDARVDKTAFSELI